LGEKRARRQKFFAQHPICCFCGGGTAATTEDHQPGRAFFRERQWPEGFVFPACEPCNSGSRVSENIVALLVHGESENEDRRKYRAVLASVRQDYPDLIASMLPGSANEIRKIMRNKEISLPPGGTFSDVPLIKLDVEFWTPHFEMFARKLLLALHYQCFGEPLSNSGRISYWINTNADAMDDNYQAKLLEIAEFLTVPHRQNKLLGDQFLIRWNYTQQTKTAVFIVSFHGLLIVSGLTTEAPESFLEWHSKRMVAPFIHDLHDLKAD
jgi:hypothetical protein